MKDIIIIGAGGFGLEVIDLIEDINKVKHEYNIMGFLDDKILGNVIGSYSVIGKTSEYILFKDSCFVIAIADPKIRRNHFEVLKKNYCYLPNLIHPLAKLSNYASLVKDAGIIVNVNSIISGLVNIAEGVIIDSLVYIGHETKIEKFSTLYSGTMLAGNVRIKQEVEIGMGARIIQNREIGENSVIGAGSTVINDIPCNVVAVGSPCKPIKEK
jgi:sugar O-acyltransferase (sialic acid O-acetyltransferase NeuD family)